jgi:hypothetical protein
MIIGIAGRKGSGKSTVADKLCEVNACRLSFAGPLKLMTRQLLRCLGTSEYDIHDMEHDKEQIVPALGISYRVILQTLGTEWGRNLHSNIWLLCAGHSVLTCESDHIVFDDVRFGNEADFIRSNGGLVIHLMRVTGLLDDHASESGIAIQPGDAIVGNNGSLDGLYKRVWRAIEIHVDSLGIDTPSPL